MKFIVLISLMVSIGAGPIFTQKFGSGYITRTPKSVIITNKFGQGFISRERFSNGKTATHFTYRFGNGILTKTQKNP